MGGRGAETGGAVGLCVVVVVFLFFFLRRS